MRRLVALTVFEESTLFQAPASTNVEAEQVGSLCRSPVGSSSHRPCMRTKDKQSHWAWQIFQLDLGVIRTPPVKAPVLGRKWPSFALRRFSYFRSSTKVLRRDVETTASSQWWVRWFVYSTGNSLITTIPKDVHSLHCFQFLQRNSLMAKAWLEAACPNRVQYSETSWAVVSGRTLRPPTSPPPVPGLKPPRPAQGLTGETVGPQAPHAPKKLNRKTNALFSVSWFPCFDA